MNKVEIIITKLVAELTELGLSDVEIVNAVENELLHRSIESAMKRKLEQPSLLQLEAFWGDQ